MIVVSDDDIRKNHNLFIDSFRNSQTSFLESSYIKKAFPLIEREANRNYPYEVKLPKSLAELAQGDFEPSRIITVEKPFSGLYSNVWFGDATYRCTLRCGYVDGNSSKLCQQTIGAEDIHMVLGGATGQGKSVTLNSIIFGLCLEFAPWEVDLTLCDAKIVEFKSYALQHPMPHIRRIAATEDADYIISVLDTLNREMLTWNNVFTLVGKKKIDDFRKVTGLAIPQHIIIIDEFQTMFKNAKKKMNTIIDLLNSFARLGRSTGFHLLLASQELGSDLPKEVLSNISIRAAMGCDANVSEMILGNDEAKNNKGQRGRMIINKEINLGKEANVQVQVPFMPDDERLALGKNVIELAKSINYETTLSFYDAETSVVEDDYKVYLHRFKQGQFRFLLGEPSFVKDGEQVVSLDFTGSDIENILVIAPSIVNQHRYFKMLKTNAENLPYAQNIVIELNDSFSSECDAKSLATGKMFSDKKSFDNDALSAAFTLIARRKLCLAIDKYIFSNSGSITNSEDFYKEFQEGSEIDTELNKQRFAAGLYLLSTDKELHSIFELDNLAGAEKVQRCNKIVGAAVDTINLYGCQKVMLDKHKMPPIFVWILGIDRMIGLGRDPKFANIAKLKKMLQDCTEYNFRFIMFTGSLTDMSDLKHGIRWVISDGASLKDINQLTLSDHFPDQISSNLAVLSDLLASEDKCVKFKKMRLRDEIFTS
jgi:hypothetical protein